MAGLSSCIVLDQGGICMIHVVSKILLDFAFFIMVLDTYNTMHHGSMHYILEITFFVVTDNYKLISVFESLTSNDLS